MKKNLGTLMALAALTAAILLSGCTAPPAQQSAGNGSINVYNWGEYIDESLLDEFTQQTGIKVNYTTYDTNESMHAKLMSGGAQYDVIIPSDYMIARLISEDMLQQIDTGRLENYALLDSRFTHTAFDPDGAYSVPYMWGTVGIIYNTTMVEGEIDSWDVFWDETYKNQMLMFDNSRDAIGIGLRKLGYSYNTEDSNEIRVAAELMKEQQPLNQAYVMDQIFDKMENNEAAIAPYYAGDAIMMMEANPDLDFALPKEGSNVFIDSMCIPKNAPNPDGAHAFIDFMCSTDAALANAEYIGYSTPQIEALEQLDPELRDNPIAYPPNDVLARCDAYTNLSEETLLLYDELWVEIKSGG